MHIRTLLKISFPQHQFYISRYDIAWISRDTSSLRRYEARQTNPWIPANYACSRNVRKFWNILFVSGICYKKRKCRLCVSNTTSLYANVSCILLYVVNWTIKQLMKFWHCCRRLYTWIGTVTRNRVETCRYRGSFAWSARPCFFIILRTCSQSLFVPNHDMKLNKECSHKISI